MSVLLTGKRRILTSGAFVAGVVVCLLGALLASGSVPLPSWRPWQGVVVAVARKDYLAFLQDVIATYWARFGWMDLKPPAPAIWVWVGILSLATVGWMLRPRRDHLPWLPLGLLLAAALAGWALTLRSSHQVQGRFFLPFAPIIALILARGLQWVPRTALILLMASVVGAHAVSLAALASRYRAPDGPQDMAMDAHQCTRDRTVLELLSQGNQVGQTFFSTRPGLCAIDVVFSGSQRQGDAVLRVSDPATGQVLREARRACASLRSGRHERFTFRPLMKSGGRVLEFSLLVTAAERDANLSVWFKLGDPYLDGVRVVNGERRDGDLWFVTWVGKEG